MKKTKSKKKPHIHHSVYDFAGAACARHGPHLETWISRAEPSQQEALRELIRQFQMQLIKNQFRKKP